MNRIKSEPAVAIGIIAACILAIAQTLVGQGVLGSDVGDTIAKALDPSSGWVIPIVLGIVTRFFVSPAASPGL